MNLEKSSRACDSNTIISVSNESEKEKKLARANMIFTWLTSTDLFLQLFNKYQVGIDSKDQLKSSQNIASAFNLIELNALTIDMQINRLSLHNYHVDPLTFIQWLEIPLSVEILNKNNRDNKVAKFCDRVDQYQSNKNSNNAFEMITGELQEMTKNQLDADLHFSKFQKYEIDGNKLNELKIYYNSLDLSTKFRWILFLNVIDCYQDSLTLEKIPEGIIEDKSAYAFLKSFIEAKNLEILKRAQIALLAKYGAYPAYHSSSPVISFPSLNRKEITLLKGMPKIMPNAGNTCYISSTLWPLYALLKTEIIQKIKMELVLLKKESMLLTTNEEKIPVEKRRIVLKKLKKLFNALNPASNKKIEKRHVEALRVSVQQFSPDTFAAPNSKFQEDAYDFLICLMSDALGLDSCSLKSEKKFYVIHNYVKIDNGNEVPSIYKLEAALKGSRSPEPVPMIDIRLPEIERAAEQQPVKLKLSELSTKEHNKLSEVHAYLKDEHKDSSHPSFFPFAVTHSEQIAIQSKNEAPDYFIGRLTRFAKIGEISYKRKDCVEPEATLEFPVLEGGTAAYDLVAVCTHMGESINSGHYYSYLRINDHGTWSFYKYDDTNSISACSDENFVSDVSYNGYIFYYKKREEGQLPPSALPEFELKAPKRKLSQQAAETSESKFPKLADTSVPEVVQPIKDQKNIHDLVNDMVELIAGFQDDHIPNIFSDCGLDIYDEEIEIQYDEIKTCLNSKEVQSLIFDLELYQFSTGSLMSFSCTQEYLEWLKISSLYQILDKNNHSNKIVLMCKGLEFYQKVQNPVRICEKISNHLYDEIMGNISVANILEEIKDYYEIDLDKIEKYRANFSKMAKSERLCWHAFIVGFYLEDNGAGIPAYIQKDSFEETFIKFLIDLKNLKNEERKQRQLLNVNIQYSNNVYSDFSDHFQFNNEDEVDFQVLPEESIMDPFADGSFNNFETNAGEDKAVEASAWLAQKGIALHCGNEEYKTLQELVKHLSQAHPELSSIEASEGTDKKRVLEEMSKKLKKPIYVIDKKDHELYVLDGFAIPGELFRYGDEFSESILYLFCSSNGKYVELKKRT